jgi:hypothetical protein
MGWHEASHLATIILQPATMPLTIPVELLSASLRKEIEEGKLMLRCRKVGMLSSVNEAGAARLGNEFVTFADDESSDVLSNDDIPQELLGCGGGLKSTDKSMFGSTRFSTKASSCRQFRNKCINVSTS